MAEKSKSARNRARTASVLGVGVIGAVTASLGVVPPAFAANYPSWSDVQKAKHDVATQKKMISRINGLISQLQDQADAAATASMKADNAYSGAVMKLHDATDRAAQLKKQVAAAEKKAETSRMRAGLLASHLARGGGGNLSIELFLKGGNGKKADDLLYQLGTMSKLTQQSQSIYSQAVADQNNAESLTKQAKVAQRARKRLADEAEQALQAAKAADAAAQAAVQAQQKKSDELVAQLATLKNTSVATEKSYQKGVAVRKAAEARRRAEEAARRKAAEEAARRAAKKAAEEAAKHHSGSGHSGGSSTGPASSGHSSIPNSNAVERAIAFAKAQLGEPYVINGAGPNVWDCSGLTMKAYGYAGINIGAHWVPSQYNVMASRGELYPYSQRRRGDLLFWSDGYGGPYHVAIYLGNNMMIAAPKSGDVVKIQPVWGYGGDLMMVVGRPAA